MTANLERLAQRVDDQYRKTKEAAHRDETETPRLKPIDAHLPALESAPLRRRVVDREPSTVVTNLDRPVRVDVDLDVVGLASQELPERVSDDALGHRADAMTIRGTDVHRRSVTNGVNRIDDLDLIKVLSESRGHQSTNTTSTPSWCGASDEGSRNNHFNNAR